MTNNHYIYSWSTQDGIPFYIGQGTYEAKTGTSKYRRAYKIHYGSKKTLAYCQHKANKLSTLGFPHVVRILYDCLTIEQANIIEQQLIKEIGRTNLGTGTLCNLTEGGEINPMHDPEIKAKHLKKCNTEEYIKKMKPNKITWNDVEFISNNALARHLGISDALLKYRLKNNIPLDFIPNRGNKFRPSKRIYNGKRITHNGIEYNSMAEMARSLNISIGAIRHRISHKLPIEIL